MSPTTKLSAQNIPKQDSEMPANMITAEMFQQILHTPGMIRQLTMVMDQIPQKPSQPDSD